MAYLVQMVLPVSDNGGQPFAPAELQRVRRELTETFGGLTAYTRAPAEGFWEDPGGRTQRDDVIVVEVMTDTLDRTWWGRYAFELARRFRQEELVVRAIAYESIAMIP